MITLRLRGLDGVSQRLKELGPKVTQKVLYSTLKATLDPIEARAKTLAPSGKQPWSPWLRRSIDTRVYRKNATTVRGVTGVFTRKLQVGTVTRGKNKGKPVRVASTRYAHLVEFGSQNNTPRPFMRSAWASKGGEQALQRFQVLLSKELARLSR